VLIERPRASSGCDGYGFFSCLGLLDRELPLDRVDADAVALVELTLG